MRQDFITTDQGFRLDYFDSETGSDLLIYHHGTPAAGPIDADLLKAALENDLRVIELVRPGYGQSTRVPGRSVADISQLAAQLADHFGFDRFVTLGWSGGGPHALATVALQPSRCVAGLSLAGVGAYGQNDLDFLAGMGQDNIEEFGASAAGEEVLRSMLTEMGIAMKDITGAQIVDMMSSLLPAVDQAVLTGELGEETAAIFRWAVSTGIDGWLDDDLAFIQDWGFDLASIQNPVALWQGSEDLMVPFAHGKWLATKIPSAQSFLLEGEGHLSIGKRAFAEGLPWLKHKL
ncbi:MAG: alpha/beta hydrolase [Actinobacteria bacterium]|nr:alpha/beta hydrolase [Actinomycetota bacterium]